MHELKFERLQMYSVWNVRNAFSASRIECVVCALLEWWECFVAHDRSAWICRVLYLAFQLHLCQSTHLVEVEVECADEV